MGTYTTNLNLYNTNMLTDGNDTFDFTRDINDNNDKIDAFAGKVSIKNYSSNDTYKKDDIVMSIVDDDVKLFKSLVNNNVGNAITNETYWQKVELGGGGGFEIGDIGIAPLGIDETKNLRRYANGQVIVQSQFQSFTTKLKNAVALYPSLVCTEAEWQTTATLSVGGQVGKFVIDDTAGTIRLPKIIMPIQGLTNLASLAEIVEAGLPNIKGWFSFSGTDPNSYLGGATGAFKLHRYIGAGDGHNPNISGASWDFDFNASNYSSIYKDNSTVQQEQIQYPYFIQVATGVEESVDVTREIELNNPFCLLDYKYSEYELDNISWLRSNGQYNSKAVYPDTYDLLLKIYNGTETKAGVSVKLSTETYTDTDFVLNTTNETFRLPLKVALASGKAVVGNGYGLGLCSTNPNETTVKYLIDISGDSRDYIGGSDNYATPQATGVTISSADDGFNDDVAIGVSLNPELSGIETSDSDLYLYFYVGETVQNANLINAGRIEETLSSIIPDNSNLIASYGFPDNTYTDLTLGASGTIYTAPSNGWFYISKQGTAAGQQLVMGVKDTNNSTIYDATYITVTSANAVSGILPVKQGDKVEITYQQTGQLYNFRFIYAKGSESEAS